MADSWIGMPREVYLDHRARGSLVPIYRTEGPPGTPPQPQGWDTEAWATF